MDIYNIDIWNIICDYIDGDITMNIIEKNKEKINWEILSSNKSAYYFLEKNKDKIQWNIFLKNNNDKAIELIDKYFNDIKNNSINNILNINLNKNKNVMNILLKNPTYIYLPWLYANDNILNYSVFKEHINNNIVRYPAILENKLITIDLLKLYHKYNGYNSSIIYKNKNKEILEYKYKYDNYKLDYESLYYLSCNNTDYAVEIFNKYIKDNNGDCNWHRFHINNNDKAIEIILKYPTKINWVILSQNSNKKIFNILKNNKDKVNNITIWLNKNYEIIENNIIKEEINWNYLCKNTGFWNNYLNYKIRQI